MFVNHKQDIAAIGGVLALALAFAPVSHAREQVDLKKVNRYAMAQEQEGVRVAVSWQVALHSDGEFLPLLVNVVNFGSGPANVELKNFRLVDEDGQVYMPASYEDVLNVHRDLSRDKRVMRSLDYGGLNTRSERLVESSFYPYGQRTQDSTTELITSSQMIDMVYFHVPKGAWKHKMTLEVEGIIDAPPFKIPFAIQ